MAFDNYYPNRKDFKRVFETWHRSKAFDRSCRNHGDCPWCVSNRTINLRRTEAKAKDLIKNM
jgi:hypothetical protein